ncbi:hypothetical protein B7P43_G17583 [Cryptotermes secundus]|uniref:Uncharacterized protein n=1 Tax=Cryptotermes secundus TaxID=105785 RepID=A0A2J7PNT8_9NEOP|nr:hypothetical protein B7P43_G17583 [Cryptotermes secundus]
MLKEMRVNQVKADADRVQMQEMFRTHQEEMKADRKTDRGNAERDEGREERNGGK